MEHNTSEGEQKKREDKRIHSQLRPIDTEQGLLNRADGSAKYSQGKSTVLAAVYGPLEAKRGAKEQIDKATIDVVWRPRIGPSEYFDREKEYFFRGILESVIMTSFHPRTSISIIIQVIQDDAMNAVCLALLDAGLPLHFVPISITCAVNDGSTILMDPTESEEKEANASFTFTFASSKDGVVMSKAMGEVDEEKYFECLRVCKAASAKVLSFIRLATESKASKAAS